MFVLRSPQVRPTFTSDDYGRSRQSSQPVGIVLLKGTSPGFHGRGHDRRPPTRRYTPVDSAHDPSRHRRGRDGRTTQSSGRRPGRRRSPAGRLQLVVHAGHHHGASGGKLSSSNAAYIAADLKAPAGSLTAAGSTFVQPFFTKAFYTYTGSTTACRSTTRVWAAATASPTSSPGSVDFAASDVPMPASDLAKVPASSGPVIQIPDILGGVSRLLQPPRGDQAAQAGRRHPGRHLRRHHQDVERLPDHGPQPGGDPALQRHRARGAGRQLGDHLHLHRLPDRRPRRRRGRWAPARPSPGRRWPSRPRRTPGWPPASSRRRTRSATSSWPTPSRTTSPSPPSRTPPVCTWCPSHGHGGRRRRPEARP